MVGRLRWFSNVVCVAFMMSAELPALVRTDEQSSPVNRKRRKSVDIMLTCVMCELWYKAEISKPPSIVKLVAMLTKGSNEAQREVRENEYDLWWKEYSKQATSLERSVFVSKHVAWYRRSISEANTLTEDLRRWGAAPCVRSANLLRGFIYPLFFPGPSLLLLCRPRRRYPSEQKIRHFGLRLLLRMRLSRSSTY